MMQIHKKFLIPLFIVALGAGVLSFTVARGFSISRHTGTGLSPSSSVQVLGVSRLPEADDVPLGAAPATSSSSSGAASDFRLSIPKIKVDAHIDTVGQNSRGEMDVPLRLADVGWYEYGTPPGEKGSAVIAGHLDGTFGQPAVFYNLKKLSSGDDVYVTLKNGRKLHFTVTAVDDYKLADAPRELIFNDASGRKLRLITCAGSWDLGSFAYDHRIVVTAELVS